MQTLQTLSNTWQLPAQGIESYQPKGLTDQRSEYLEKPATVTAAFVDTPAQFLAAVQMLHRDLFGVEKSPDPTTSDASDTSDAQLLVSNHDHSSKTPVLGLDAEWRPVSRSATRTSAKAAVLQIASRQHVFVVDLIALFDSEHPNAETQGIIRTAEEQLQTLFSSNKVTLRIRFCRCCVVRVRFRYC